jgi:hypothetical protein
MHHLTNEERARVIDSKHSVQAATASLSGIDRRKVPKLEEIEECLENADKTLSSVLRTSPQATESTRE